MNFNKWQHIERVDKFLNGVGKELPVNKKLLLTPVVLDSDDLTKLKDSYAESTKRVGFLYTAPLFRFTTSVQHKHMTYMICSAYQLRAYDEWLMLNYGMRLQEMTLDLNKVKEDIVNRFVRYKKGSCEDMRLTMLSTKHNDNYYGYKIIDEIYPFREIMI